MALAASSGRSPGEDDGALQVTTNGLPLYFFSGDHAVGNSNGVYTSWEAVKP